MNTPGKRPAHTSPPMQTARLLRFHGPHAPQVRPPYTPAGKGPLGKP